MGGPTVPVDTHPDSPAPPLVAGGLLRTDQYIFKRAETPVEFEQIHRLNHATFVREIGGHADCGAPPPTAATAASNAVGECPGRPTPMLVWTQFLALPHRLRASGR